jgi:hypothetical protein
MRLDDVDYQACAVLLAQNGVNRPISVALSKQALATWIICGFSSTKRPQTLSSAHGMHVLPRTTELRIARKCTGREC